MAQSWRHAHPILGAILLLACSAVHAQAIDCAGAALNNSERAVCASISLRSLAASIDGRYRRVAGDGNVRQSQLDWVKARNRCNGNMVCLTTTYRERNAFLAALPPASDPISETDSSRAPLKHLFLRHAPAQLLNPVAAQQVLPADGANADDKLDQAAGGPRTEKPRWNPLWLLIGVMFTSALLWQMLTNVCGKCPSCHHWFARVEIDQRNLADDALDKPVRRRRRQRMRALTTNLSDPESVRGRVATVRHYNQCRMCLHEWETTSQETL